MVDGQPLSAADLQRLKSRRATGLAPGRNAISWRRPSGDWRQTSRWALLAARTEARDWRLAVPGLVRGEFVFTLALWVAVFSVTAAIVAQPAVPIKFRYSAGLAAVAYLYLYGEISRLRRLLPGRRVLLSLADASIVIILGELSAPFVGYAHLLVFFVAARIAVRFTDPRALPAGLLLLIPFDAPASVSAFTRLLDAFAVLTVMLIVQQLQVSIGAAQLRLDRQTWLSGLISALARARDQETLVSQLVTLAAPLVPQSGWVFWIKEDLSDDFRALRWSGLGAGERPVLNFTPALPPDRGEPILITGPLPGTATGAVTLVQPVVVEGEVAALLTVGAGPDTFEPATRALVRSVAEEAAVALARLQSLDAESSRRLAMEQANRLAGLAAASASDHTAAMDALLPELSAVLRAASVHLEWVDGDQIELVVGSSDALSGYTPRTMALAGSRTADALNLGRVVREATTGRRPEDLFCIPAGLRHILVVPLRSAGVDGTLQVGRRDGRPFTAGDALLVELLAERLALLFAGGLAAAPAARTAALRPRAVPA